jgi:hypothetical protein
MCSGEASARGCGPVDIWDEGWELLWAEYQEIVARRAQRADRRTATRVQRATENTVEVEMNRPLRFELSSEQVVSKYSGTEGLTVRAGPLLDKYTTFCVRTMQILVMWHLQEIPSM